MPQDLKQYINEMVDIFQCDKSHWLSPEKLFQLANERIDQDPDYKAHLQSRLEDIVRIEKEIHQIREDNLLSKQNPVISNLATEFDEGLQSIMHHLAEDNDTPES